MLFLLSNNPVHPDEMSVSTVETLALVTPKVKKEKVFGRFFTPLMQIITNENTLSVPKSEVRGKFVGKQVGAKKVGHYIFVTNMDNLISYTRSTLPSRLNGVRRIWMLDTVNTAGNLVYKSMVGDKLVLTEC